MPESTITVAGIALSLLDVLALAWFAVCWLGYAAYADHKSLTQQTLVSVMDSYRLAWMLKMLARDNRIVDTTSVANLQRSISFFASTTIFILLGLMASLGRETEVLHILDRLPYSGSDNSLWQIKVILLIMIFIYAFFKYTWSLRQYNYVSIFISAAPLIADEQTAEPYALKGAHLSGNSGKHFNLGLRAYYFGLAALSWFLNAWLFIIAATWVVYVVYRREFRSHTLSYLLK